jgi:hypothetical protein
MQYKIEFRPLAAMEVIEAYDWYESQREGLGLELLDAVETFYDTLLRNPFTYSYYEEPVRQGKLKRFPYAVVYEVFDDKITIYSVFMAKQDPGKKRTF